MLTSLFIHEQSQPFTRNECTMTTLSPWFVMTASFDILHSGHRDVIRQAAVLSEAFSDQPLFIITYSTNPKKQYLLTGEDKRYILESWIQDENIPAKVYVVPWDKPEDADREFERMLGKPPTAPEILLISGIKEDDVPIFRKRNRTRQRNTSRFNEKKVYVVSSDDTGQFGSSTAIKRFLLEKAPAPALFHEAIAELLKTGDLDKFTARVLLRYREKILQFAPVICQAFDDTDYFLGGVKHG
jgi:hypothetical protein